MRYWWVNQNQTHRQEIAGGYLWSPKRNANGARNPFYEFMREVSPGDVVFSFVETRIAAIGIAQSYCYESPKPSEFGDIGPNWELIGWRVRVRFTKVVNQIRPKDHMEVLRELLPGRYSPLQPNGNGIQSVYLTSVPPRLAETLSGLIGKEATQVLQRSSQENLFTATEVVNSDLELWEHHLETELQKTPLTETERESLIIARRGQGLFKQRVMLIEKQCRITLVDNPAHLVASHCKPWRDASNTERLNGENGLLLTPTMDHLFDRGFISFESSGELIISPVAHKLSLSRMGIQTEALVNVGGFTQGQQEFLNYHRHAVLLRASR